MREVDGVVNLDVVVEGDVFHFDSKAGVSALDRNWSDCAEHVPMSLPLSKELDLLTKSGDIFW